MSLRPHLRGVRLGDEGASLVVVVLFLPLLILMAALAVDTANWFVHKRHLQTQADAGALAAARDFQFPCGASVTDAPNPQIIASAHQYDGTAGGAYNPQVSTPASPGPTPATTYNAGSHDIFSIVNGANYINQSVPNDTGMTGDPCADRAIDLKLSETNLPWLFKAAGVDYINAQARVSLKGQGSSTGGQVPLAIPLPTPKVAAATFLDEGNSAAPVGPSITLTGSSAGTVWTGSGSVTVPAATKGPIGMRIALGGDTSTTCGIAGVACYDPGLKNNGDLKDQPAVPDSGIVLLRPWTTSASATPSTSAPEARDATLASSSCDPYFSAGTAACPVTLALRVDADTGAPTLTCADLKLTLKVSGGATPATQPMTCPTAATAPSGTWLGPAVSIPANSGPVSFTVDWEQTKGKINGKTCKTSSNPADCSGSFGVVERSFTGASDLGRAGGSRSGPISYATVTGTGPGNSLEKCSATRLTCTYVLSVEIHVYGLSTTQSISDPYTKLHLDGSQGNQAVSCVTNSGQTGFSDAVATGCKSPPGPYKVNPGNSCPAGTPLLCITPLPGGKTFQPELSARIQCGGVVGGCGAYPCVSPNYWTAPHTISEILAASPADPRLVQLFITPSNSFDGSGASGNIPIRAFASFYITGYAGGTCAQKPLGFGTSATKGAFVGDDPAGPGEIVGHFVTGRGTGEQNGDCAPTQIGDCVAVLTK